jgi:hypothetical protein
MTKTAIKDVPQIVIYFIVIEFFSGTSQFINQCYFEQYKQNHFMLLAINYYPYFNFIIGLFGIVYLIVALKKSQNEKKLSIRFEKHKLDFKGDYIHLLPRGFNLKEIKKMNALNILSDSDYAFFQRINELEL